MTTRATVVVALVAVGSLVAACAAPDPAVVARSAVAETAGTTGTTGTTTEGTTSGTDGPGAGTPDGPASDGVGDELFPELGNPGIDVVDYHLRLRYDPADDRLAGSVALIIEATQARDSFTLDATGLDVSTVTVDGDPATFVAESSELRITPRRPLSPGRRFTVVVTYVDLPDADPAPGRLPMGWFHADGGSYVLNEPDGARSWLPSNDHPSDKATWTFDITVPAGTTAVANGVLVSTTPGPDGDTWSWRQDDPMPTYLVQLLTGDYVLVEGEGPGGLPLLSAVLRSDVERVQSYLDAIGEQIDFFDDLFGPYPLAGYGIAITDSFPGLAMETQGRSMFSRDDLDGATGFLPELLLSHELAHQWFGNAVSPGRWIDIWLNESFASYSQWLWFDRIGLGTVEQQAERALAERAVRPGPATGAPSADELFGFNSYDGGAVVLHALRLTIGDDDFFTVLRRWVADNNGTSRVTDDFIALAEQVSGEDLGVFFDTWLDSPTVPTAYPEAPPAMS
jgi:aminopeptidase N